MASPPLLGLLVANRRQFVAHLLGQLLDMARGDGQAGQTQGEGGVGKGVQASASGDDLLEHGGAIAVSVEA